MMTKSKAEIELEQMKMEKDRQDQWIKSTVPCSCFGNFNKHDVICNSCLANSNCNEKTHKKQEVDYPWYVKLFVLIVVLSSILFFIAKAQDFLLPELGKTKEANYGR